MRHANELMLLIAEFLFGARDAKLFADAFEVRFNEVASLVSDENQELRDVFGEIAYDCAFYDVNDTKERHLLNETAFREKVMENYLLAIPLVAAKKV